MFESDCSSSCVVLSMPPTSWRSAKRSIDTVIYYRNPDIYRKLTGHVRSEQVGQLCAALSQQAADRPQSRVQQATQYNLNVEIFQIQIFAPNLRRSRRELHEAAREHVEVPAARLVLADEVRDEEVLNTTSSMALNIASLTCSSSRHVGDLISVSAIV